MKDNYPYPHPMYIGHMMKSPHPIAWLAYALTLWINPNNHSLDGGRASEVSYLSKAIFEAAAAEDLHLAMANLPCSLFRDCWERVQWNQDNMTCLRSCLMKQEHMDWIGHIWQALDLTTNRVLNK